MKKRIFTTGIVFVAALLVLCALTLSGCSFHKYSDSRNEFFYPIEDNLGILSRDPGLLCNPDRGYRGEMYITLGRPDLAYPDAPGDPYDQIDKELNYEGTTTKVIQTYVYLIEFYDKDLSAAELTQMTDFFKAIRDRGAKMLLRFAYEFTDQDPRGPTTNQIVRHCAQLKEWFMANETLAYEAIYSVQLGMIGLWGEGHNNVHNHNVNKIVKAVYDMVPAKLNIMVRYPDMIRNAPKTMKSRLTVHDDFLVGVDHPWGLTVPFNDPDYGEILNMSRHQISDGEMPWGRDKTVDEIDPLLFLKQAVGYGLTTLSIKHNYMEGNDYENYELYRWRNYDLTEAALQENRYPYNPKMLTDGKISLFEYLNYHLGYQIALSNSVKQGNNVSFMVNNYGFAAPLGYRMEVLANGEPLLSIRAADMELYRFGQYVASVTLPNVDAEVSVRFVSERDGKTIRIANDLPGENGTYQLIANG